MSTCTVTRAVLSVPAVLVVVVPLAATVAALQYIRRMELGNR